MRNRIPPALKHGAYSATAVLPGESQADFDKLHRDLITEYAPSGVHENYIVMKMARRIWRGNNLGTQRIAERAQRRWSAIRDDANSLLPILVEAKREERMRAADDQARQELGDIYYELAELGEAATFDGLIKELEVEERLDAGVARCLKELLLVRGVKSVAATPEATSPKRALAPPKAA